MTQFKVTFSRTIITDLGNAHVFAHSELVDASDEADALLHLRSFAASHANKTSMTQACRAANMITGAEDVLAIGEEKLVAELI